MLAGNGFAEAGDMFDDGSGDSPVDCLVIGGGINGAGIARDAAGRGLSVVLCEAGDLGQATSAASTKLIHGGLRYLEHKEFRLVREALLEREVLLAQAPHIIWPLTFVLPQTPAQRPRWMLRLGLLLYDHMGGRSRLPASRAVDLRRDPMGAPLQAAYRTGFAYADCWVEDSRLVVLNALDAAERGAMVQPRTRCVRARRGGDGLWHAELAPGDRHGPTQRVRARSLVNAAGPWVSEVLSGVIGINRPASLRLVKGSHMVVPRLYAGEHAYIFQNTDGRVLFAIPYEGDYTLLGTTDEVWEGDPGGVSLAPDEARYICDAVNRYFKQTVRPADAVWSYAGVRPLYDDSNANVSAVTRDYVFDLDDGAGADQDPPLLSIFGGKITTYRRLAEHATDRLLAMVPETLRQRAGPAWTRNAHLPGGDIPHADFETFFAELRRARPWLPVRLARRYARAYGTRTARLLGDAECLDDLGQHLGDGVYAAELDYLREAEWARTLDDVLWRRSKLGLHISPATRNAIARHLDGRAGADMTLRA
jgi:glycerol-3-phosphate dehydrogenase